MVLCCVPACQTPFVEQVEFKLRRQRCYGLWREAVTVLLSLSVSDFKYTVNMASIGVACVAI